ncbi:MAG: preprotein translocase subunit SecE [Coriobacteriaceae bacterium]|nr:preprotein translocase subunit SecE [Coriobacteriaceae bacterium]
MAKNRTTEKKSNNTSTKVAKPAPKSPVKSTKTAAKTVKGTPKKESLITKIRSYFHNVRLEIKRTTWPNRTEVFHMSLVVVAALLFFGVLIFALDSILYTLVELYSKLYFVIGAGA